MKLDPKVKAKWVKALKSGKYQKTSAGHLKYKGRFCCLGVACEIGLATPVKVVGIPYYVNSDFLPHLIQIDLATMNDGSNYQKGLSLRKIADWIQENL